MEQAVAAASEGTQTGSDGSQMADGGTTGYDMQEFKSDMWLIVKSMVVLALVYLGIMYWYDKKLKEEKE